MVEPKGGKAWGGEWRQDTPVPAQLNSTQAAWTSASHFAGAALSCPIQPPACYPGEVWQPVPTLD